MTGRPNSALHAAVAILMFSVSVPAQIPLTLTGWNADVIYENDGSPSITASVDYNGDTFAENELVLPAYESSSGAYIGNQSVVGLPNGGVLTSLATNTITGSHTSFALQDYNANNAALLRPAVGYLGIPGYAGNLSLTTPQRLSSLALLHTSTIDGGQLQINATLTFEDNSKGSFSFLSNNWRQEIGAPLSADTAINRVERVKDGPPEGTGPDYYFPGQQKWVMYEVDINLTALGYDTKAIKSIALDRGDYSESYWLTSAVFAVSGSKLGNRNEFLQGTDLLSSVNYQLRANPSIHRTPTANSDDVLLETASGTNLSLNNANLIMGSLNVTNATTYTLGNDGAATTSVLTLGTSSNSISAASPNDLIHLGPSSNGLTIRGTSSDAGTLTLALTRTGNFNVQV